MYSSSPNLIKHYIPINFSQASLDYNSSSPKKYIQPKLDQNPFTNTKLQSLHKKHNDFVLIFKNKTSKDFIAKKKVKYSSVLKIMKKKNDQIVQLVQKEDNKQLIQNMQLCESNKIQFVRSRRTYSMDKFRQFREQSRECSSPNNKSNRMLQTRYSSVRQKKNTARSAKENQDIKSNKSQNYKKKDQQIVKNLVSFKIRGTKAPQSETVDFLKKMRYDSAYNMAEKLIK